MPVFRRRLTALLRRKKFSARRSSCSPADFVNPHKKPRIPSPKQIWRLSRRGEKTRENKSAQAEIPVPHKRGVQPQLVKHFFGCCWRRRPGWKPALRKENRETQPGAAVPQKRKSCRFSGPG